MNICSRLLVVVVCLLPFSSVQSGEIGKRPYELDWAGRVTDTREPLIDFENLDRWTVAQTNAESEFSLSQEQQLWGDHVGKLVYRGSGDNPVITIAPPQGVPVSGPFDCVNLWVRGNNWGWAPDPSTPQVEIRVLLQSADGITVPVVLGRVRWQEWWLMHTRLTAQQLTQLGDRPRFVELEIRDGRNQEDRTLYFDNLVVYKEPLVPLKFEPRPRRGITLPEGQTVGTNTGPGTLPFPARDETILPDNLTDNFQVSLDASEGAFDFRYTGDDGTLIYHLRPSSGTLSDVTAKWVGRGETFQPLDGGGVLFASADGQDPVPPESCALIRSERIDNTVRASWRCQLQDKSVVLQYTFRLWQKSLVVDVECQGDEIGDFRLGRVVGATEPRLITVPYLTGADQRPGILISGTAEEPLFMSALLDHCRSNSSLFWFTNQVSDNSVAINGGARYLPQTDGKRNRCFERLFLTVSPRFEETLPNIPNPQSPWMHVAGERVWSVRGASDRQRDYEHWRKVARYGMTKVAITDHETGWRDGGESFTMRTRAAPGKGGDAGQAEYAKKVQALGFRYGIYNNYTDYSPVNEYWDEDYVTRLPDNQWRTAWPRCYNPKPARAVELEALVAPIIQEKFQLDTAYCDVHTAVQPWSYVDFDARVPGAGTFAATFYAYGEIMLHQKRTWNGPVYSEGNNHWYYCGLTDGNYGQDQLGQLATNPWLVDFDLRKMHPLCCNFGMGSPSMFYGKETSSGETPADQQSRLDRFLAATLAFGHTGFLVFDAGFPNAIQSYYAVQQVHARYAQQKVESIRYANPQGKLLDTSQAVATGIYRRNQIATRYNDGLEVYVNGHPTETWSLPQAELPPNGWYAHDATDHSLTAFGAIVDGHRADYVDSPAYVYANGRGKLTRFPRATCDGQLIANWLSDGSVEVIPVDCSVLGIELNGQAASVVALDEAAVPLGTATTRCSRGLVYITPVANAFSYRLTLTTPDDNVLQCERVHVIPGETITIAGTAPLEYQVPLDADGGQQVWFESAGHWLDFTTTPLVDASLTLGEQAYHLDLKPHTQLSMDAVVELGTQSHSLRLRPDQKVTCDFPRPVADQEMVRELPLQITAGKLDFHTTWWIKSEFATRALATVAENVEAGQRLRGKEERGLDAKTGAGVYWTDRACGDDMRRCLFMHPPYIGGVGYSFALLQPVELPMSAMTFRCDIGKADQSHPGDGIQFQVAVIDSQGSETTLIEQSWAHHAWTPLEGDLSRWKGQRITIKLVADVGPANNSTGDWACWSKMRIESSQPELVTAVYDKKVDLTRESGPYSAVTLTIDELRSARSGRLHFRGIGLEHGAPYVSTASLNGVPLGELPAARGDEKQGVWSDARIELSAAALASVAQWNVVALQNLGRDSFKVGWFWIELALPDGRQLSSQITRTVFTQPAEWLHAEGTGVPFDRNIETTVRIPLRQK